MRSVNYQILLLLQFKHLRFSYVFDAPHKEGRFFAPNWDLEEDCSTWIDGEIIDFLRLKGYAWLIFCERQAYAPLNIFQHLIIFSEDWVYVETLRWIWSPQISDKFDFVLVCHLKSVLLKVRPRC